MIKKYKISRYIEAIDLSHYTEVDQILLFAMRSGKLHRIKKSIYKNLQNQKFELIKTNILSELIRDKVLVKCEEDEIKIVLEENDIMAMENKSLYFVIQPGANCQLGCHYCGQVHTKHTMTKDLMDKVLTRIETKINISNPNADKLSITWYGAEPLLALNQIRYLTPKLLDLARKYNLNYDPDIITNAVGLKKNIIEDIILKLKIYRFQITIDGSKEYHDKRRYTKSGKGTFDIILNNLVNLINIPVFKKNNCLILLRINIDRSNYRNVNSFINYLAEKNIQEYTRLDFAPIVDWGGNNASKISLTREELAQYEINWFIEALKLGFMVDDFLPSRGPACMVVNPISEVYDSYGDVTPCYEMNYTDMYKGTDHIIGNLISGKFSQRESPLRKWHADLIQDYPCYNCKYLPVCGGSCPKNWLKNEPTCPTFKFNLGDRLVLEYLKKRNQLIDVISV